jgi:hypothetical protein
MQLEQCQSRGGRSSEPPLDFAILAGMVSASEMDLAVTREMEEEEARLLREREDALPVRSQSPIDAETSHLDGLLAKASTYTSFLREHISSVTPIDTVVSCRPLLRLERQKVKEENWAESTDWCQLEGVSSHDPPRLK